MDRLPAEILLLIADQFLFIFSAQRCQLLQVCRRWRSVLFHAVYDRILVRQHRLPSLMRAIAINPSIGSSIKHLRIIPHYVPKAQRTTHEVASFAPLIQHISQSPEEVLEWTIALTQDENHAWLGLLLVSLENLTSLSMTWSGRQPFVRRIVSRAAMREGPFDTDPILQYLEGFDIDYLDHKDYHVHQQFFPFFHLPSMRSIRLECVIESTRLRNTTALSLPPAGTSPITSLDLRNGNSNKGMAEYITACANLQEFKYQHRNQAIWAEQYIGFRPRAFYHALVTQKHSLRVLHLNDRGEHDNDDFSDDEDDAETDDFPGNFFGSLSEFTQLWDLRIPVVNLLSFHLSHGKKVTTLKQILPRSLKRLYLADFRNEQWDPLLRNLLEVVALREMFPYLERLEIQTTAGRLIEQRGGPPLTVKEAFEPLAAACEKAGIQWSIAQRRR
ncbi:hypothetical protein BO70DRAFT_361550 [Aspergillus heteromorphus CBS 117.55]|uniref:Uncharacterized protein n=1 Tax=Aspergillus heteromorphus CBS 117.55 TaxID=1448321 RepID=A0A317WDY2_9EURO|nr:uncharacterized protein BO70DRAFT_361550 [Aspergillus heteromorphus CBS 117.55]PWY83432.1 hypothetical protein BO70DRAFT_361550 [Aspergillus heteromorphus CBS 117.55]